MTARLLHNPPLGRTGQAVQLLSGREPRVRRRGRLTAFRYLAMDVPLPQRVPENAPGDFYVMAGSCTRCCLVHGEAPDLLNDPQQSFEECYFRRQPHTPEEIDRAISAISVSEMAALRYGGNDPTIVAKLRAAKCGAQCDQTDEGQAWLRAMAEATEKWRARAEAERLPLEKRASWWRRLIGW
ncbi:MAG: hypothetical protein QOE14_1693 [Humisphaera sp.]|nr:hypothetical protein [Humisphaera sp.]